MIYLVAFVFGCFINFSHAATLNATNSKVYGNIANGSLVFQWKANFTSPETLTGISIKKNEVEIAKGNGTYVAVTNSDVRISIGQPVNNEFSLTIKNLKFTDDGNYTASATFKSGATKSANILGVVTESIKLSEQKKEYYFADGVRGLITIRVKVKPTNDLTISNGFANAPSVPTPNDITINEMPEDQNTIKIEYQLPPMKKEYCNMRFTSGIADSQGNTLNVFTTVNFKYKPAKIDTSTIKIDPFWATNNSIHIRFEPINLNSKCHSLYNVQLADKNGKILKNVTDQASQVVVPFASDADRKNATSVRVQTVFGPDSSDFTSWKNFTHVPPTMAPTTTPASSGIMLATSLWACALAFFSSYAL